MTAVPPNTPLWTAAELLAAAAERNHTATRSLIRDWVQLGLLDRPSSPGLGPGRGRVAGRWSENQRQLFLSLLSQRSRKPAPSMTGLCNVPVLIWLIWGDEYLGLDQVRRVMRTWAARIERPKWSAAERRATEVVKQTAARGAKAGVRRRLMWTLTELQAGDGVSDVHLLEAVRPVHEPAGDKRPRGVEGAQLTPERYAGLVEARRWALEHLADLSDARFIEAREEYRRSRASYARRWTEFAADPDLGHLHPPPTLDSLANTACLDLLSLLGLLSVEIGETAWSQTASRRQ